MNYLTKMLLTFIFSFFLFSSAYALDVSGYRFHTIPVSPYYHGIQSIVKDSIGRIWYSGQSTLFMYDGNSFYQMDGRISSHSPELSWTFGQLWVDYDKRLYVMTNHGLFLFDYASLGFTKISEGWTNYLTQDADHVLWIKKGVIIETFSFKPGFKPRQIKLPASFASADIINLEGTMYLCARNGKIYKLKSLTSKPELFIDLGPGKGYIRHILKYKKEYFVLTENEGLFRTDESGRITRSYPLLYKKNQSINAKKLYMDPKGVLWVGTQLGLFLLDLKTDEMATLVADPSDRYSLPHNSIWSIYPDPDGGVWIGTYGGKLAYMSFNDNRIVYMPFSKGGLNSPIVSCFEEDEAGNIWIGTEGGGINCWDRTRNVFSYYTQSYNNGINYNLIKSLLFDAKKEKLLISSYNGGISEYSTRTKKFEDLKLFNPSGSGKYLSVYNFELEADSGIWLNATTDGLFYKDLKTNRIRKITVNQNGKDIVLPEVESLYRDKEDYLWLFSHEGVYVMDVHTYKVVKHHLINSRNYSVNMLICHTITSESDVWIGTMGGGVNLLSHDGTYKNFREQEGFRAHTVFSILEDSAHGNIWFSTNDGIYYYNKEARKFSKLHCVDTDLCGTFYPRSSFRSSKGELFFGGTSGFIMFDPQTIRFTNQKSHVFFTGFFINNSRVMPGTEGSPLKEDISVIGNGRNESKPIVLSYKQSNIEIQFSTDNYVKSNKEQLICRLLGASDEWLQVPSNKNSVRYYNLLPGSYTFEIKVAGRDGMADGKVTTLSFRLNPPPWLSAWAYLLYGCIFLALIFLMFMYLSNKKNFRHKLEMEKLEKKRIRDLEYLRINFFTNISHELKTPLTLIIDPLKRLSQTLTPDHPGMNYTKLIAKNVVRIQRLVSQLLQFREIESNTLRPRYTRGDLILYVTDLFAMFTPLAEGKYIITQMDSFRDRLMVSFDQELIEKIFSNLFSNAIKYTPEGESISIRIYTTNGEEEALLPEKETQGTGLFYLSFDVINTGTEISVEETERLFKPFSRISPQKQQVGSSTGLGLSIVKELVTLLGGTISVLSRTGEVCFRLTLPFRPVPDDDAAESGCGEKYPHYEYAKIEVTHLDVNEEEVNNDKQDNRKMNKLLIIEDDDDLRNYLKTELSGNFRVYTAKNGEAGIALAKKISLQIILTDIMMPVADGYDVCDALRGDIKTSHIPIIAMSGFGGAGQKIKALKKGADVFIEKQFDIDYLEQQINNLIDSRAKMRELYSKKYTPEPSNITITSMDEELMNKAVTFVENNIQNPGYDVEMFVSDMGISRTLLYRKINDITHMTIKEFILDMRLKRSKQLLEKSEYTISEIALLCGFNDSKYFSTCFRKHCRMAPSDYRKQATSAS